MDTEKQLEGGCSDLLAILNAKQLHVHEIPQDSGEIYRAIEGICMYDPRNTHYVMRGGDVVHIGTTKTAERFAYSFSS